MNAFLHNFADLVEIESTWMTAVTEADASLAEERVGLVDRPKRAVTFLWSSVRKSEVFRFLMTLARQATDWPAQIPLYSDQAVTTASSSATTINCPTTDRRFRVGGDVVIMSIGADGRPGNVEVKTISSFTASAITLTGALTNTYAAESLVFPVIYGDEILEADVRSVTDEVAQVRLTIASQFDSAYGTAASSAAGANPSGFSTQAGLPILGVEPNWATGPGIGVRRKASTPISGKATIQHVRGERCQFALDFGLTRVTRAEAMAVIRFFDSRGGRLMPFWVVAPQAMFEPTVLTTGYVDVTAYGDLADAEDFVTYLGLLMSDGTYYVRQVSTITVNGSDWRIALTAVLPSLSLANVVRVAPAYLVRFVSDALVERWVTDAVCEIPISVVEVVEEQTVAVT